MRHRIFHHSSCSGSRLDCALPAAAQLPDGAGKDSLLKVCGTCHQAERSASVRLTREGWEEVIADMIKRGAKGHRRGVRRGPRVSRHELSRRRAAAAQHQPGHEHRARERRRPDAQGSRRGPCLARQSRRVQVARRAQEGPGPRLQEDRGAQGLHRVLRGAAPAETAEGPARRATSARRRPQFRRPYAVSRLRRTAVSPAEAGQLTYRRAPLGRPAPSTETRTPAASR